MKNITVILRHLDQIYLSTIQEGKNDLVVEEQMKKNTHDLLRLTYYLLLGGAKNGQVPISLSHYKMKFLICFYNLIYI